MERGKILLAEGSEDLLAAMAAALESHYSIQTCTNGTRALELLETFAPDFIVLDLELPGLDGFSLLQDAAAKGIHPLVLALTRLNNAYISETASELGIAYVMMKPFAIHALLLRLNGLIAWSEHNRHRTVQTIAANQLAIFQVRDQLDGYTFLLDAVALMMVQSHSFVTKDIYPAVGKKHGCSKESVEHSIRVAIQDAWKHGPPQLWQRYFPTAVEKPPSNTTFLNALKRLITAELEIRKPI